MVDLFVKVNYLVCVKQFRSIVSHSSSYGAYIMMSQYQMHI